MIRNFADMLEYLNFALNFNERQTDEDFTQQRHKQALNLGYVRECNKAIQEGLQNYFLMVFEFTWLANEQTFPAPEVLQNSATISWRDVTDDETHKTGIQIPIVWETRTTLRWKTEAPTTDRTVRVQFMARPSKLVNDADEPVLLPLEYRELIVWSAAVELRLIADKEPPPAWERRLAELRFDFYKYISRGRPYTDVPMVQPLGDSFVGVMDNLDSSLLPATDGTSLRF